MKFDIKPVVKWAGGKRQLLPDLLPLLPKHYTTYCEPFLGGGAMFFHLKPQKAIINDINRDLMNLYTVIKEDVELLLKLLKLHKNRAEYFYEVRGWDRDKQKYNSLSKAERAARFLYLNKTCYNGLFRVNKKGEFNVPFGKYKNPNIMNKTVLFAINKYFQKADISIICKDYSDFILNLPKETFIYLDPPYDSVQKTSFTNYTQKGFTKEDQVNLRKHCDQLDKKGIKFMLSNSSTDFIREQYKKYNIITIKAKRMINCKASGRKLVNEVVIRNYV